LYINSISTVDSWKLVSGMSNFNYADEMNDYEKYHCKTECYYKFISLWKRYVEVRDMNAHNETVRAQQHIAFAVMELRNLRESTSMHTIDPRFKINCERLVQNAMDEMTELKQRYRAQLELDDVRFLDAPYNDPRQRSESGVSTGAAQYPEFFVDHHLNWNWNEWNDPPDGHMFHAAPGPRTHLTKVDAPGPAGSIINLPQINPALYGPGFERAN
jgi:hypothetical protein